MIRTALASVCLALTLAAPVVAQEAAVTRKVVEVRETPGDSARSIATLPAQAPVTRSGERQGPWIQVRTASGATGWVHLFDVGPASTAAAESSGGGIAGGALRGVTGLFGGSRTSTQTGSTAGIRGLGAEDLAQAQPNPQALTQMEALRANEADVRSFAGRAPWRPAAVDPLPEPARATTAQPGAGQREQQLP
jgi:hypothetical protein